MRNMHKENLEVRILHFLNCIFFKKQNKKFRDFSCTNQHSTFIMLISERAHQTQTYPFSHNNKNFASKICKLFRSVQLLTMEFIIVILLNGVRCITNTRTWWRILHSTSDERSESHVLCNILHHTRVLVIHLKQFTSICITFTLLNKQNLNLMQPDPWWCIH